MGVLIVEHGAGIAGELVSRLFNHGRSTLVADTVASAREMLHTHEFDVVVLDPVLPDGDGLELIGLARDTQPESHLVVLCDTSTSDARDDVIRRGAHSVVAATATVRELEDLILAATRRGSDGHESLLRVGQIALDLAARTATIDEQAVDLTSKEFDLLAYLAARPGHVFSREQLLRAVWHSTSAWQKDATVTEHIGRLRAKIEADPRRPRILTTVRGSGYRLDARADETDTAPLFEPCTLVHVGGRIVKAQRATCDLFGLRSDEDLVGREMIDLAALPPRPVVGSRFANLGDLPLSRTQLVDFERADGTVLPVRIASEDVTWEGGTARQLTFSHLPDLTLRPRRLAVGVFSDLTDAVIVTDVQFHLRSWNKAAERLYGWSETEVLGRHILDVLEWTGSDDELAASWASLATAGKWHGEAQQVTRDGSVINVLGSTTLLCDETGEPSMIVSVNRLAHPTVAQPIDIVDDGERVRQGLTDGEFEVHYQPVVTLHDRRVVLMEALLRWNHPERGLLTPESFMAAAEQGGAVVDLGIAVLDQACEQVAHWRRSGADIELAANVASRQLTAPGLVEQVENILERTGLEPDKLWLEVTETSLVDEAHRASEVLHRLSDLGVGIAVDNFGTGWASLTYLSRFPVHALKIDRSFIAGVGRNLHDTAIARSVLALGFELGLYVVAAGIETEAQLVAMRKLGCAVGQGHLFGRPTPAALAPIERAGRLDGPLGGGTRSKANIARHRKLVERPIVSQIARLTPDQLLDRAIVSGLHSGEDDEVVETTPTMDGRLESRTVTLLLRGLLRAATPAAVVALLQEAIRQMGGLIVSEADGGTEAMSIDVTLGEGIQRLYVLPGSETARTQLERLLPMMSEDAARAADALRASH